MHRGIPVIGALLEQSLGHVSHGRNLQRAWAESDTAEVRCRELDFAPRSRLDRVPPRSNWTVRSSLAARAAVRDLEREGPLSALFVHTHVPAALLGPVMARIPTIVSIDATPKQIDRLGSSYNHPVHPARVEALKDRVHRRVFHAAAGLVTWSQWAADSLVEDYGVDPDRIDVVPPGVIPSIWRPPAERPTEDGVVRVLFVGGDFERKGGGLLLDAVAALREDLAAGGEIAIEVDLVTGADVPTMPGVRVHRGLTPNCPELVALYHRADVFALPTLGDCSPMVLAEAATAGIPAITTDIGAIRETVLDGVTGHLVEPTVESVTAALRKLVVDPSHRATLGAAARAHAAATMDAEANARRVLERLVELGREGAPGRPVWLTVSGAMPPELRADIAARRRPTADYVAMADATGARLVDRPTVHREASATTRLVERILGSDVAMATHVFRNRRALGVVVTDGEQVGIPLAALLRLGGRRGLRHVMIGHRLSPSKKALPVRLLGLGRGVDEVFVYASSQLETAQRLFRRPGHVVERIDFMVDTDFFRSATPPFADPDRPPRLATAGREFRDYPTLIEAVRGLDVDVVIASASPWSRRADNAHDTDLPPNVVVDAFTQAELRDEFAAADVVVVPLQETDFQAGITTILEAMAMARPVVCTRTEGQTDVVVDGINGRTVPPGDPAALRSAIEELLADPGAAVEMGRRGRELVEARADVRAYADRFARAVRHEQGMTEPE